MNKIDSIMVMPKIYKIQEKDVEIYPLDFEDNLLLLKIKNTIVDGKPVFDTNDENSRMVLGELIRKKLKESFTEYKENGEKFIPTNEQINKISQAFCNEYMTKLFEMSNKENDKKK